MENILARTPVNTRLGFDGPGGCAIDEGPVALKRIALRE
jgi:hypothetical protein